MRKSKKLLSLTALCLSLFLLASCSHQRINLSPEETHRYCEEYFDYLIPWKLRGAGSYCDLKGAVYYSMNPYNNMNLCLFEVESIEIEPPEKTWGNFIVTIKINEVYSGDLSLKGTEAKPSVFVQEGDSSRLVGKKYVGYLTPDASNPRDVVFTTWTFLVTDDNTLVSPFGCQVEEAQIDPKKELSLECRSYTGQKLDYFISVVKSLEAELEKEAESSSEK